MGFRSILAALPGGQASPGAAGGGGGGLGCILGAMGRACCSHNSAAEARQLQAGPGTARGAKEVAAPAPCPQPLPSWALPAGPWVSQPRTGHVRSHSRWGLVGQRDGLSPSVGPGCSQQGCPHTGKGVQAHYTRPSCAQPPRRLTSRGLSRPSPGLLRPPLQAPCVGSRREQAAGPSSLQHRHLPAVGGSGSRGLREGSAGPTSRGRASRGAGCLGQPPACSRRGAGGSHSPFSRLHDGGGGVGWGWGGQPPS